MTLKSNARADVKDVGFRNIVSASHPRLMEFIETNDVSCLPRSQLERLLKVGAMVERENKYFVTDEAMSVLDEWEEVWTRERG